MSFDPNYEPGQAPEPSEETPGESGAAGGTPQAPSGENAAGEGEVSWEERYRQLESEKRISDQRVGMLSQELQSRYEQPPSYAPPNAGNGSPPGDPPPGQGQGRPSVTVELPEEVSREWEENYGVAPEHLASFAQGIAVSAARAAVQETIPMAQQTVAGFQHAMDVTHRFYSANPDLEPYKQDLQIVARQFMSNPNMSQGRPLEHCLPEIGNEVRRRFNLKGTTSLPGVSVGPREAASVEAAQTASGGSAGGASRTGRPPAPAKKETKTPAQEYIEMHAEDTTRRVLGGTRLGRRALEGTKIK